MKKLTAMVLVALLIAGIIAMPVLAESIKTTVTTTNGGDVLNVRKGPHKGNTPVVGYVRNGTRIILLSTDDEYEPEAWNRIRIEATGAVGYLKNKYIRYFGLDNSDGELDKHEDDDWDYSDSGDNDGQTGSGSSTSMTYASISCKEGGSVNVRSGSGTSYKVITSGTNGDRLHILSKHGSWYKVKFANRNVTGYVHSDYVSEGFSAEINANGVNFRRGAGTNYASIRKLSRGTYVYLLSKSGSWSRIKVGSTYGWVSSQYISY